MMTDQQIDVEDDQDQEAETAEVVDFPATDEGEGTVVEQAQAMMDDQEEDESDGETEDGGFDVAKQEETHKAKLTEISEHLAQIDDKIITDACERRLEIDKQREALNKQAAEIREELKEEGIEGAAFNAAYSRYKMDKYKRELYDQQFAKCANAMEVGYQPNLFGE